MLSPVSFRYCANHLTGSEGKLLIAANCSWLTETDTETTIVHLSAPIDAGRTVIVYNHLETFSYQKHFSTDPLNIYFQSMRSRGDRVVFSY